LNNQNRTESFYSFLCPYRHETKQQIIIWIIWSFLFSLAYTQSPLYTSNQNQYFLHGIAQSGFGNLRSDWLANTLDPTPVFSLAVRIIAQYLNPLLFYFIYACIFGLYLFSLVNIIRLSRKEQGSLSQDTILVSLVIILHSAGWRFAISRLSGPNWSYILEAGFADQRLLGPVLQPSSFGVLLLLSLYFYMQYHPFIAIFIAISAAIIHPTYLLPAASFTFAYLFLTIMPIPTSKNKGFMKQSLLKTISLTALALLLITPTLVYTYQAFGSADQATANEARNILVTVRIPHHADIASWFDTTAWVKLILFLLAMFVIRHARLFPVMLITGLIVAILTVTQLITRSDFLALLFPWRASIVLIPLSTFLLVDWMIGRLSSLPLFRNQERHGVIFTVLFVFVIFSVLVGITRQVIDQYRKNNSPEAGLFQYIRQKNHRDNLYLIPVKLQDFRLETGVPVFVDFKSIPYRDVEVLEWQRRLFLADDFYNNPSCDSLTNIIFSEKITDVVVPSGIRLSNCNGIFTIYKDKNYNILSLDQSE
jgi:hypothetical protein